MLDIFDGFGSSEKDRQRRQGRRNRQRGKMAEDQARLEYEMQGFETRDNHAGYDFDAIRRDPFTGEVTDRKKVEVKSGNARLTERQKREKRRSDNYEVERMDPLFPF